MTWYCDTPPSSDLHFNSERVSLQGSFPPSLPPSLPSSPLLIRLFNQSADGMAQWTEHQFCTAAAQVTKSMCGSGLEWGGYQTVQEWAVQLYNCTVVSRVGSAACLVVSGGMTVSARQPSESHHGSGPSLLLSGDGIRARGRRPRLPWHWGGPSGQETEGCEWWQGQRQGRHTATQTQWNRVSGLCDAPQRYAATAATQTGLEGSSSLSSRLRNAWWVVSVPDHAEFLHCRKQRDNFLTSFSVQQRGQE